MTTIMPRGHIGWLSVVLGLSCQCLKPVDELALADADSHAERDAGVDADAGHDAGGSARVSDAGVDGGRDAGTSRDAGADTGERAFDASCPGPIYATPAELALPPRPIPWLELLIIEATGSFMASDDEYRRAEQDLQFVWALRDAGVRLGALPDYDTGILVTFQEPGASQVVAGTYTAWDCLNRSYGAASPRVSSSGGTTYVFIDFRPLNTRTLSREYARLPHVLYAEPNGIGIGALCGSASDLCVSPSASGTWTWLAKSEGNDCGQTYYRVTTQPDGGRVVDQWDAGAGPPTAWFEQSPQCAMNLWGNPWRHPDGGIVQRPPDGG